MSSIYSFPCLLIYSPKILSPCHHYTYLIHIFQLKKTLYF
nr:MAG TPA: hypothetical protein [Caudoviricetes sp.]